MTTPFDPKIHLKQSTSEVASIKNIVSRLHRTLKRDDTVQRTTDDLRAFLQVDRVAIYYFYKEWEGRVTFESLSDPQFSILGDTGPDECFNGEYAAMYASGRVSAIANIETADIAPCHRDFLRHISVQANLVVPILPNAHLWGLLVAHHCQGSRDWSDNDIERIQKSATTLANAPSIKTA
ncbi:MAG: GAF domain-containing protein [Cyanobacteria bacterium J06598_1]